MVARHEPVALVVGTGRAGLRGAIEAWLRRKVLSLRDSQHLSTMGLVPAACMDSTDLRDWSAKFTQ